jgi:beta-carotene 3-hydroxylase
MSAALTVLLAFLVMEPVTAVSHRLVMHRFGWSWHRSHHRPHDNVLERNDLYPLVFAVTTFLVFLVAAIAHLETATRIAAGIALYGFAYSVVHDVVIHQRLGRVPAPITGSAYFRWVADAHRVHHLYARAPFGFLCPLVPSKLRIKAQADTRDPLHQLNRRAPTVSAFARVDSPARREKTS